MKIALIKQDVYQDLYVGDKNMSIDELLFSSSGRVGPLSLFTHYDCDFYIVKEEKHECGIWKLIMPKMRKEFLKLKDHTVKSVKGMEFHEPGTDKTNGDYSISCNDIDWSQYQIVISINVSIPSHIVKKYSNILWCYMIGEANFLTDKAYFGYDLSFNQLIRGEQDLVNGVIDFPYTFVDGHILEQILVKRYGHPLKRGIYGEINTTTERPVRRIPQFEPISAATNEPVVVHKQKISDNLESIYKSKYYLKVGGRKTRGNGAIEAISCGTVVLMSPDDIICGQILPKSAWVYNAEEAIQKIHFLNSQPEEYEKILAEERALVDLFVIDYPQHWLEVAYKRKIEQKIKYHYKRYSFLHYAKDIEKRYFNKRKRVAYWGK